jgi:hypothetical protein
MNWRVASLVILPALALPLLFYLASPSPSPTAPPSQTAVDSTSPGAASAAVPREDFAIGPAFFPHGRHARKFAIDCARCHHETNAAPLSSPHENYFQDFWIDCSICHRGPGTAALEPQACSTCHHSPNGNSADQTLSSKVVIHKNCWSCHDMGTGAKASSACKTCHAARS